MFGHVCKRSFTSHCSIVKTAAEARRACPDAGQTADSRTPDRQPKLSPAAKSMLDRELMRSGLPELGSRHSSPRQA